MTIYCACCTKENTTFCKLCAHLLVERCYTMQCKNPPIHYIVFATPHKNEIPSPKERQFTVAL